MKRQRNTFQTKEQDKTSEKEQNKIGISKLPDKEFKVILIHLLTKLGKRMGEVSENFNKFNKIEKRMYIYIYIYIYI